MVEQPGGGEHTLTTWRWKKSSLWGRRHEKPSARAIQRMELNLFNKLPMSLARDSVSFLHRQSPPNVGYRQNFARR